MLILNFFESQTKKVFSMRFVTVEAYYHLRFQQTVQIEEFRRLN